MWPFNRKPKIEQKEQTLAALEARLLFLNNTSAGESITPITALRSPTIHSIVNLVSRTVASLKVDVLEVAGETRTPVQGHFVSRLLNQRPNNWQSANLFKQVLATHTLLWGNFYAYKRQASNGRIFGLDPISNPDSVNVVQDNDFQLQYRIKLADQVQREISQRQMFHVRGVSIDGICGIKPVEMLRESIALEIAAEKFGAELFGSGALPAGILKYPIRPSTPEEEERIKNSWTDAFRKKRGTAVLYGGADFQPLQVSNEDAQFLETRRLQREIISAAFGIPPPAVGILERATFNNVSELGRWLVIYMLTPFLANIEQQIWFDMIPDSEKDRTQVKFNVKGLLRGDQKTRSEALKVMREWGVISSNEWRALEDMNPISSDNGGDIYLHPMNMVDPAAEDEPDQDDDTGNQVAAV